MISLPDGATFDPDTGVVTNVDGSTIQFPPLAEQQQFYAERLAAEQSANEAQRAAIAALTDPIVPKAVTGTTVATVKASADAAIKDVAAQTEQRLQLLADVLGT